LTGISEEICPYTLKDNKVGNACLPVKSHRGIHLGTRLSSWRGLRTPSKFPNMVDRPRLKSMTKKSTAHTWEPGMASTASVNTMNARPVPDTL